MTKHQNIIHAAGSMMLDAIASLPSDPEELESITAERDLLREENAQQRNEIENLTSRADVFYREREDIKKYAAGVEARFSDLLNENTELRHSNYDLKLMLVVGTVLAIAVVLALL